MGGHVISRFVGAGLAPGGPLGGTFGKILHEKGGHAGSIVCYFMAVGLVRAAGKPADCISRPGRVAWHENGVRGGDIVRFFWGGIVVRCTVGCLETC